MFSDKGASGRTRSFSKQSVRPNWWRRGLRQMLAGAGVLTGILGVLLTLRILFFSGPFLPLATEPDPADWILDMHCHVAGLGKGADGEGDTGCFVSARLRQSMKFRIYLQAFGVTLEELENQGDPLLIDLIAAQLAESREVRGAVLLALDGRVDPMGRFEKERTEVYVPTEYIAREVRRHTNLWLGASIHPHRADALERVDWAATNGAVLVKWIPSIMGIDPAEERLRPFYQRLIQWGLPLLTHTGMERSFTNADDWLCDPERLRLPLEMGVTVIAAHGASTGSNEGERDVDRLKRMLTEYPNLYADISSLTQLNKLGYLGEILTSEAFEGRLLYGSDFPLVNTALVSPWFFPMNLTHTQMRTLSEIENCWDRDVALKRALGVPGSVFTRWRDILRDANFR